MEGFLHGSGRNFKLAGSVPIVWSGAWQRS